MLLAELDGLHTPNAYGHHPLIDDNPTQPNEPYFQHVDAIIDLAAQKGLYIGLLPTWGDKVLLHGGVGPVIFTEQNAGVYGRWIGQRYADRTNILWIIGGDRTAYNQEALWTNMAKGIREGVGGPTFQTFHPRGVFTSSIWFPDSDWLDMQMIQSGHHRNSEANWEMLAADYARQPVKPVLVGEACYEDIPEHLRGDDYMNAFDTRKAGYWSVFAGGCGYTYGHNAIWQMLTPNRKPVIHIDPGITWQEAIDRPGAGQMIHLRRLMESRPYFSRVPDQTMILNQSEERARYMVATRDDEGRYAMVYLPLGGKVTLDLSALAASELTAWWYNPRTGGASAGQKVARAESVSFDAPPIGTDWVLVLDAEDFGAPGVQS